MLTEKDKAWLEKRAVESCDTCKTPRRYCALCCRHQKYGAALRDRFSLSGLNLFVFSEEYRDAAEFEAAGGGEVDWSERGRTAVLS